MSAITSCATLHCANTANLAKNSGSAADWYNASASMSATCTAWVQQNIDGGMQPAYASLAALIKANGFPYYKINYNQTAQNVQVYDSLYTAGQLSGQIQSMLYGIDPGEIQDYAISVCENGMASQIQQLVSVEQDWGDNWGHLAAYYGAGSGNPNPPIGQNGVTPFGRSSDACGEVTTGIIFLGIAFLTLSIAAGSWGTATVFEAAAWGSIAKFAGDTTSGIAGVTAIICP